MQLVTPVAHLSCAATCCNSTSTNASPSTCTRRADHMGMRVQVRWQAQRQDVAAG